MLPNRTVVLVSLSLLLLALFRLLLRHRNRGSSSSPEAGEEPRVGDGSCALAHVCVRIRDRVENGRLVPDHTHGSTV